jgi:hypothetical protein
MGHLGGKKGYKKEKYAPTQSRPATTLLHCVLGIGVYFMKIKPPTYTMKIK